MKTLKQSVLATVFCCLILSIYACSSDSKEEVLLSDQAAILSFTLNDYKAVVTENSIELTIPKSLDVKSVLPKIEISAKASLEEKFEKAVDLTTLKKITVTAENGSHKKNYQFKLLYLDSDSSIHDFAIKQEGVEVNVDQEKLVIDLTFPSDFKETKITPTIVVAEKSSVLPKSGEEVSLEKLKYTITAEDGTTKVYEVKFTIKKEEGKDAVKLEDIQGRWRVNDYSIKALCTPAEYVDPMSVYFTDKIKRTSDNDNFMRSSVTITGNEIAVYDNMRRGEKANFKIEGDFLVTENPKLGFNGKMKIVKLDDKKYTLNVGNSIVDEMMHYGTFLSFFRSKDTKIPENFVPGKIMVILTLSK